MPATRVLIVDDEPNIAMMVAASLEKLGGSYITEVAYDGDEALNKLQQANYELVITDYNMPGLNGLDLSQAVRHISPGTQVVLMTAYSTNRLREAIGNVKLDGYIDKPFSVEQIREIVEQAVGRTRADSKLPVPGKQLINETAQKQLNSLQVHTHARCVLLISSSGFPVCVMGEAKDLDTASISALVAANFLASIELANLLGSHTSMFKSSYHEGNDYNIYSYDVNGELLLAVIFGAESKPGIVWFYTKQTALELEPLLINRAPPEPVFDGVDVEDVFGDELDKLFSGGRDDQPDRPDHKNGHRPKPNPVNDAPAGNKPSPEVDVSKPMTFEQAVAAGLVPYEILRREKGD